MLGVVQKCCVLFAIKHWGPIDSLNMHVLDIACSRNWRQLSTTYILCTETMLKYYIWAIQLAYFELQLYF